MTILKPYLHIYSPKFPSGVRRNLNFPQQNEIAEKRKEKNIRITLKVITFPYKRLVLGEIKSGIILFRHIMPFSAFLDKPYPDFSSEQQCNGKRTVPLLLLCSA
jgi:hypothetical protein